MFGRFMLLSAFFNYLFDQKRKKAIRQSATDSNLGCLWSQSLSKRLDKSYAHRDK